MEIGAALWALWLGNLGRTLFS